MAYDTKYRPTRYADVLGQEASASILRELVRKGKGFHQSYLFCGQHGSGKTTLGRILARSLLCEAPQDGEPCDQCESCRDILEKGSSECFSEFDAATKSGKDSILRVTEEIEYATFAGKQRVYLFDESHRLSVQALDALLKPMEDTQAGSEDKQLICIFCTTEPERMASTVFSRCAPAFTIRVCEPEAIAKRLAWVCDQEGIEYEHDALVTIAAVKRSHIRDALKAVESIETLGPVNKENVQRSLRLDVNDSLVRVLAYLGSDIAAALREAEKLGEIMSPTTAYERLADIAMLSYKVSLGATKPPPYWRKGLLEKLGKHHGDYMVVFAQVFASRPGKPTSSMLALDLARLHQARQGTATTLVASPVATAKHTQPPSPTPGVPGVPPNGTSDPVAGTSATTTGRVDTIPPPAVGPSESEVSFQGLAYEDSTGRRIDPRGVKPRRSASEKRRTKVADSALDPEEFSRALSRRVSELKADGGRRRSARRNELGSPRTDPAGGTTG